MINAINPMAAMTPIMKTHRGLLCDLKLNLLIPGRGQVRFLRYVPGWTCSLSAAAAVTGAEPSAAGANGTGTGLRLGIVAQLSCAF